MTRPRIPLPDLLAQHPLDLSTLEPAPTSPSRAEVHARVERIHLSPCTLCGDMGATSRVHATEEHGPRWVDLCWEHGMQARRVSRVPSTLEGIRADLRAAMAAVAAEQGVTVRVEMWTDEGGWQEES